MTVRCIIRTILFSGLLVGGLTSARAQSDIKGDVYFLDPSRVFKARLVAPSGMSNDLLLTLPGQSGTLLLIGGSAAQGGFDRSTYLFNLAYGSGTGNATGALITSATTTLDASAKGLDIVATANGLGTSTALKLTANGATTENYALEIAAGGIKITSTLPTAVSSTQPLVLEGGVVKIGTGSGHTGTGTANTIAMWTGATALGNSMLSQNAAATIFTVAGRETITATSNQLVLGTTNTVTLNAAAPAASRVYTIPAMANTSAFIMTEGAGFSTYAAGDLLYASAANTLSKLPVGTNGQYLTITSGFPAWAAGSIMQYDVAAAQGTSTTAANWLFNVQYGTITGAATGARIASVTTAANSNATGLTLIATGTGTSTATALSLAATGSSTKYALTVADGSGYSGFGTTAPTHVVHSLNTATTDELSAVYGLADGSTSNQAMGVWGDASNNAAANTGSVGVLATGSGRTTTAETNAAIQIADGEIRVGRTTETGTGYTVVEGATAGTDYTA